MSKRGKPAKPQSKKVAALLRSLQRPVGQRETAGRFLIVCEDEKSSPNYFHALKRQFGLSATVISSEHYSQPLQVVQRAVATREQEERDPDLPPFKQTWCVIDGDYGSKTNNARAKADANNIRLAISTPCFEYWVLLHFEDSAAPAAKCDEVIHCLKKHLPDYEKGSCDFSSVVTNARIAAFRAERLRKPRIKMEPRAENHNPCSEVYRLIFEILPSESGTASTS
jgi:hypothetical protein